MNYHCGAENIENIFLQTHRKYDDIRYELRIFLTLTKIDIERNTDHEIIVRKQN